ncbi:Sec1 family protein (macronuclear) [Tetrahymena thermophila SB210]|uniref:Sec1 family protein n=1 Tax=Tetrahymena thermophila (strain SB210) TaxID=312017 RepID=W7X6Q7_TETTS|nr:Sec1 family protein [Tetrahymena thermophila SB210]EWS72063.1 Sec1 family protein [Tetrahymena thermophila SB210]|eukprot:XP_012655374.1 Sec1 family protein [Tetrahymena thermophila SB210]
MNIQQNIDEQIQIDQQFSLKSNVFQRFQELFDSLRTQNKSEQFILILDSYSTKILSSAFNLREILKFGVQCIEKLELKRKKFQKSNAIYIIEPSQQSIEAILNDFKSKDNPHYAKINIFFTRKLSKELLKQLAIPSFVIRIQSIKELQHDFFFNDQNSFSLDIPQAFPRLYSGNFTFEAQLLEDLISQKMLTVLPSLLNFNAINIITNKDIQTVSHRFSNILHQKIIEYKERLKIEQSKYLDELSGSTYIIIFDRTDDVITPAIHDLYYESMIHDLLEIDPLNFNYQYEIQTKQNQLNQTEIGKNQKDQNELNQNQDTKGNNLQDLKQVESTQANQNKVRKQVISNYQDEIFEKCRYKTISDGLKDIGEELQDFAKKHQNIKNNKIDIESQYLQNAENILSQLPLYEEKYQKLSMHMDIIGKCFKIFQKKNLQDVAEVEQQLATGVDTEGHKIKPKKIKQKLLEMIQSEQLSHDVKLRLTIIALLNLNYDFKAKHQLIQSFSQEEQILFWNLHWIDKKLNNIVEIDKLKQSERLIKYTKAKVKNFKPGVDVEFCRHTPELALKIEDILEILLKQNANDHTNLLQKHGYDLQIIEQSQQLQLQQQKLSSQQSPTKYQVNIEMQKLIRDKQNSTDVKDVSYYKSQNKFIIFILGGITYAEIRAIRQLDSVLKNNLRIILGSTHILTPQLYIEGIQAMPKYQQ